MKSIGSDLPGQGGVLAFAGRHRRVLHPMTGARTSVRAPRRDCPVQSLASSLAACRMLKADRARSFLLIRPQTYAARREQGRVNVCIAAFREGCSVSSMLSRTVLAACQSVRCSLSRTASSLVPASTARRPAALSRESVRQTAHRYPAVFSRFAAARPLFLWDEQALTPFFFRKTSSVAKGPAENCRIEALSDSTYIAFCDAYTWNLCSICNT
jgi:hypothetical protein